MPKQFITLLCVFCFSVSRGEAENGSNYEAKASNLTLPREWLKFQGQSRLEENDVLLLKNEYARDVLKSVSEDSRSLIDLFEIEHLLKSTEDYRVVPELVELARQRFKELGDSQRDKLDIVAVHYYLQDFIARWSLHIGEGDRNEVLMMKTIESEMETHWWDNGKHLYGAKSRNLWERFLPLTVGGAKRETSFEAIDAWLGNDFAFGRGQQQVELLSVDEAYWIARGFMRYGRRDGAARLLEYAINEFSSRDIVPENMHRLIDLWSELSGGKLLVTVPPETFFPGTPPRVPYWAFKPWVWEDNVNTQQSTLSLIEAYKERGIPTGAVIIDSPWSTAYNDFNWDSKRYSDPKGLVDRLHAESVKVVVWLTGTVNKTSKDTPLQADAAYHEVEKLGYAVDDGRLIDWWKGSGQLVDFTNPAACAWWADRFDKVAKLGIDGWKVDQSDDFVDEGVSSFLGVIEKQQWRQYYYAAVHDLALNRNPNAALISRPFSHQGGFGSPVSKCMIGWSGDFEGDWKGMRKQLRDLYVSALAGYGTLYYEVGGYHKVEPSKEQLIRHAQLGAFFPVMSNGGANGGVTAHLPWFHDEETVEVYRRFAQWHAALAPYFFGLSIESHLSGESVLRGVDLDRVQHRVGEDLLVAPVFDISGERDVKVEDGEDWLNLWTRKSVDGRIECGLLDYPVFVRKGAVLALDLREGLDDWGITAGEKPFAIWIVPGKATRKRLRLPMGDGIESTTIVVDVDEFASEIEIGGTFPEALEIVIWRELEPKAVNGAASWGYDQNRSLLFLSLADANSKVQILD